MGCILERIAIIGLGLMGGSLALALKEAGDIEAEIIGFSRRSETVVRAKDGYLIDRAADDLASAVQTASLVIIATPVMAIREVMKGISGHLSRGCVVTDVGDSAWIVGPTGEVVPIRKPQALVEGWRRMLDLLQDQPSCRLEARNRIVRHFGLESLLDKTESVLRSRC